MIASNKEEEIGQYTSGVDFLYSLASSDKGHSITMPILDSGERVFETARAVTDSLGNVSAVVVTRQALSLADIIVEKNIQHLFSAFSFLI